MVFFTAWCFLFTNNANSNITVKLLLGPNNDNGNTSNGSNNNN